MIDYAAYRLMLCELESHSCVLINKSAEEMSSLRERINK